MGVTRKYIRGRIYYVPSEKCFQICDLREASRRAHVDSSAEMERTDAGCGRTFPIRIFTGELRRACYIFREIERASERARERERQKERKRERKRKGKRQEEGKGRERRTRVSARARARTYKWDGGALQILSSVNSHDPHSFRSLILSRVAR